jgi:hypothetical protein
LIQARHIEGRTRRRREAGNQRRLNTLRERRYNGRSVDARVIRQTVGDYQSSELPRGLPTTDVETCIGHGNEAFADAACLVSTFLYMASGLNVPNTRRVLAIGNPSQKLNAPALE